MVLKLVRVSFLACWILSVSSLDQKTSNSSSPQQQPLSTPIVNVLQIFSYRYSKLAAEVAAEVFRERLPDLWLKYQIHVEHKSSGQNLSRNPTADPQFAMQAVVKSILDDSHHQIKKPYLFSITFNGPSEARIGGLITPLYNLCTVSTVAMGDDLSNVKAFPLSYRICPTDFNMLEAHRVFIQLLQFDTVASVIINEASAQSFRRLENMLRKDNVPILASHVMTQQLVDDVAHSLLSAQPAVILSSFTTSAGAQVICKLYKAGILPQDYVWMISGRFARPDWWEPHAGETGWQCTRQDMLDVLNGSFAIDLFVERREQDAAEVARRLDKMNNAQVMSLIFDRVLNDSVTTTYMKQNIIPVLYMYDGVFASFAAFYRAAERTEKRYGYSASSIRSYHSDQYVNFSRAYQRELLDTSFYGATGLVSIRANSHSGQATIEIQQFQSNATTNSTLWKPIAKVDLTARTNETWLDRLQYATETGEAPGVIRKRTAAAQRQTRITLSAAAAAVVVSLAALAVYFFVRRARRRARHDIGWLIDDEKRLVQTSVARRTSISRSHISLGESMSIASQMSVQAAISLTALSSSAYEEVWTLDGVVNVHLRHLQLIPNGNTSGSLSLSTMTATKLNRDVFPQARSMFNLIHDNVNRFYGIKFTQNDGRNELQEHQRHKSSRLPSLTFDALTFLQPKGAIRNLLRDNDLQLEHEMKLLFLTDVVNGLIALHDKVGPHGFLHCDTLLLDERYTAKITDYGLQKFVSPKQLLSVAALGDDISESYVLDELVFRPPEVLRIGYGADWSLLTARTDVYSLAMIFFEVVTRRPPFDDELELDLNDMGLASVTRTEMTAAMILEQIVVTNQAFPKRPFINSTAISKPLHELLNMCWDENAAQRPLPLQVLRHVKHLPGYQSGNVMENLVKRLEKYAQNLQSVVQERTQALADEMKKTEDLLLQILPRSVANELKKGNQVPPETFDSVSIYYSDIVGFTTLSSQSTPMQVVTLLNALYTMFDSVIAQFDVYKVETIGDAYMVASGVPHPNGHQHCVELARMSLQLLYKIKNEFNIPHRRPPEDTRLKLRIGLHTGGCVAGVVGLKMPRYCLFGNTVIYANRMESTGKPLKIHTSEAFFLTTTKFVPGQFVFEPRIERSDSHQAGTEIEAKSATDKSITYWLSGETKRSVSMIDG